MNFRPLLITTFAIGSALIGAGIAVTHQVHHNSSGLPTAADSLTRQPLANQPLTNQPLANPAVPQSTPLDAVATVQSPGEFEQIKVQLRRAIQDRNPVLLRSLMRASSLREALRSVGAAETTNFENLDHSAWTMLEKAINYRCRPSMTQSSKVGNCFEQPSPQPLQ